MKMKFSLFWLPTKSTAGFVSSLEFRRILWLPLVSVPVPWDTFTLSVWGLGSAKDLMCQNKSVASRSIGKNYAVKCVKSLTNIAFISTIKSSIQSKYPNLRNLMSSLKWWREPMTKASVRFIILYHWRKKVLYRLVVRKMLMSGFLMIFRYQDIMDRFHTIQFNINFCYQTIKANLEHWFW